ncbi:hypothetical protein LXL04_023580 [Taraxacum kok-saghyz]
MRAEKGVQGRRRARSSEKGEGVQRKGSYRGNPYFTRIAIVRLTIPRSSPQPRSSPARFSPNLPLPCTPSFSIAHTNIAHTNTVHTPIQFKTSNGTEPSSTSPSIFTLHLSLNLVEIKTTLAHTGTSVGWDFSGGVGHPSSSASTSTARSTTVEAILIECLFANYGQHLQIVTRDDPGLELNSQNVSDLSTESMGCGSAFSNKRYKIRVAGFDVKVVRYYYFS